MQLTSHFVLSEFERHGSVPVNAIKILTEFCEKVLEPIRAKYGPLTITSGYRSPEHNAATGGVKTSYHQYDADKCAADIVPTNHVVGSDYDSLIGIFDWIRLESALPFDKVILECDKATGEPACIHLQYNRNPRRQAFTGETHGTGKYTQVAVRQTPVPPMGLLEE